ncbi:hypothetical protein [Rathayibacter tritici]|uniref:hypothetical protein n=1 Tax=Rathayibacter tritici TaxID=33888 RepID=UPI00082E8CDE|nr:hypothetical protein [Rathayibacter tritici]PPI43613.1 hypothetical protein C5D18_09365 [Rathayibacter tritici]
MQHSVDGASLTLREEEVVAVDGAYLRRLDTDDPAQLAIVYAAATLLRGAGCTAVVVLDSLDVATGSAAFNLGV